MDKIRYGTLFIILLGLYYLVPTPVICGWVCMNGNLPSSEIHTLALGFGTDTQVYIGKDSGAFVGDCHSIIYKGGVYGYLPAPKGKLRLYYEWMPMAYIFESLGGKFSLVSIEGGKAVIKDSSTVTPLLKSNVLDLAHSVCGGVIGNKKSVDLLEDIINKKK